MTATISQTFALMSNLALTASAGQSEKERGNHNGPQSPKKILNLKLGPSPSERIPGESEAITPTPLNVEDLFIPSVEETPVPAPDDGDKHELKIPKATKPAKATKTEESTINDEDKPADATLPENGTQAKPKIEQQEQSLPPRSFQLPATREGRNSRFQ